MKSKKIKTWLLVLSFLLGTTGIIFAENSSKSESTQPNFVQTMRQGGFTAKTASWTTVTTSTETGNIRMWKSKSWISGNRYRLEAINQADHKKVVILDDGQKLYLYYPKENKAFRLGYNQGFMLESVLRYDLVFESARQRNTAKVIRVETIDGKKCTVYRYQKTLGLLFSSPSDVKEWVWIDENFPIKSIMTTPNQKMEMGSMAAEAPSFNITGLIKDLKLNIEINNALFTLPVNTNVVILDQKSPAKK